MTEEQKLINLTIDGIPVAVKPGTTVMEASKKVGAHVPHFCWHKGLSIAGVCRLCMVKIEGIPKLQIACNTPATEGMKVDTKDVEAKEAQKWALEYHLVNHPLDCPICDQAGECKLQDYYMEVGRYDSQVAERKVLKPKALDVGKNLVLDTERCILCSRCVRFEDEISKTSSLGIFNRGDRSVISLTPGKRIDHNYSYNLADICPVGAFTVKDFRFKCRVWFLQHTKTICPGCATGCNVALYYNRNERKYYRLKPVDNDAVNGPWMCDHGRTMYAHVNAEYRKPLPMRKGTPISWADVPGELNLVLRGLLPHEVAVVLTPQYTNEEYDTVLTALTRKLGRAPRVFHWRPKGEKIEEFDGILFRGDRNPNTKGMNEVLQTQNLNAEALGEDLSPLARSGAKATFIFGPELAVSYPGLKEQLNSMAELPNACYFGGSHSDTSNSFCLEIPTKVFAEKQGTFVNWSGLKQQLKPCPSVYPGTMGVDEIFTRLDTPGL